MKENIIIQIHGGEKEISHIKNMAKNAWKAAGNLVKDIKSLDFYIKPPHENKCYYLINNDFSGDVDLI